MSKFYVLPGDIPEVALASLEAVFCGAGADIEPEHFSHVRVLIEHERRRRTRADKRRKAAP